MASTFNPPGFMQGYWKTNADGTPDYAGMADPNYFHSLPGEVQQQYVGGQLGQMFRDLAAQPKTPTRTPENDSGQFAYTPPPQPAAFSPPPQSAAQSAIAPAGTMLPQNYMKPSADLLNDPEAVAWARSSDPNDAMKLQAKYGPLARAQMDFYFSSFGGGFDPAASAALSQQQAKSPVWIGDKSPEALQYMIEHGQAVKGADDRYYYPTTGGFTPGAPSTGGGTTGGGTGGTEGQSILGSYWKTLPSGQPDYAAMADPAFFHSLPPAVQQAYVASTLGQKFKALAGSGGGGGTTPPPAASTDPKGILGTYWKTLSNGQPDYAAMADPAFFHSLPASVQQAYVAAGLGQKFRQQAVPGGGSDNNGNTGNTGEFPMASAAPYESTPAPAYTAPTDTVDPGNPMDFYNDEGYQFRKEQGMDHIENAASARGNLHSGNTLKELAKFNSGLAAEEYAAAYDRYSNQRNFDRTAFENDRNFGRNTYTDDRNFNQAQNVDERNFNNSNRMWDTTFNNTNRIDARNFDFTAGKDARDFATQLAQWNQMFDYNASNADQTRATSSLLDLARMGLLGQTAAGNLSSDLSRLLSGTSLTGAGASGAGDVGSAQTLQKLLSQIATYINNASLVPGN